MAYALDCEMIAVSLPSSKKLKSIAARVSIVDSYGMVVIDEYCQPPYEVYSYNTDYSGITPDNLIGKMSYAELRSIVSSLIEADGTVLDSPCNILSGRRRHFEVDTRMLSAVWLFGLYASAGPCPP
uniref:RNA exonuclease 4 n=1 Tax=Schistocephalus solidus TaxID=70667 RepID=A0A0V0J4B1_SCHSO